MKDYEYEPKSNSPYLRLSGKGDKVKIRLASAPIHFQEEYKGETNERFAWTVINREDGEIKGFKGGVMIYREVKKLANEEDWGDPTQYDLTITRTEEQGSYYTVTPSPKKSEITSEEKDKIKEADIDLEKLFGATDEGTETFGSKEEAQDSQVDEEEIDVDEIFE